MTLFRTRLEVLPTFVLIHAAAIAVHIGLSRTLWPAPGDEHNPGGPGDPFFIAFVLTPLFAVFAVHLVIRIAKAGKVVVRTRDGTPMVWPLLVALLWAAALRLEYSKLFGNVIYGV